MEKIIKRFRQGSSVMGTNAIDYIQSGDIIIRHEWSNGGLSRKPVTSVPKNIEGYTCIDEPLSAPPRHGDIMIFYTNGDGILHVNAYVDMVAARKGMELIQADKSIISHAGYLQFVQE